MWSPFTPWSIGTMELRKWEETVDAEWRRHQQQPEHLVLGNVQKLIKKQTQWITSKNENLQNSHHIG